VSRYLFSFLPNRFVDGLAGAEANTSYYYWRFWTRTAGPLAPVLVNEFDAPANSVTCCLTLLLMPLS
jgi:hypothetical protein